ncbi:hypothetical protein HYG87_00610 [Methanobacterium alkalithermotolerans]|uniref:Helicase C-terminal domain-containing protein n=1 Tax=Methanobacterium alkalithermotolerans TaxID=2731220 RepID=A0A8T8K5H6_9EURY|nr:helicase-related protein [Methanobacterium alkalithermotolerans]QUH22370.1 hypothetical protein HYG87_00610 [Methanobacterium alkalithermotolerans]
MDIKANQYTKFTDILAYDVLEKLKGKHDKFDRFESFDKPSKTFILGTLADKSKDDEITLKRKKTSVKNSSLSVKFLLEQFKDPITVIPSLSVYYRVYPTFEEQINFIKSKNLEDDKTVPLARIWKRKDLKFNPISLKIDDLDHYLDFEVVIGDIRLEEDLYLSGTEIPISSLENDSTFYSHIDSLKNKKIIPNFKWECRLYLEKDKLLHHQEELLLVELGMVNETEENNRYETFLFDCQMEIELNKNEIKPFIYNYNYENYLKSYESHLRCLNCHANYNPSENRITTQSYAKFNQIKVSPRNSIKDLKFDFKSLMQDSGLEKLQKLQDLMENHYEDCLGSNYDLEYLNSLDNFKNMQERFKNGLEILKSEKNIFKAFKFMNKSFLKNSKGYDSWRIFQIVFIVCVIPEIVEKNAQRDVCDLLHVMTGGGKSEAYFGIVLFSAFYDRLSGKEFGVTALTKFPLRMLSIQQLQRIANLFMWAEEIRKEEELGGEPFSIAYFVGQSKEFPRFNNDIIKKILKAKTKNKKIDGRIIDSCPICQGNVFLEVDPQKQIILHQCDECNRNFRLFFTDDEIYRFIPTFIVCTVDKLAGIALNRRFKNLFGGKIDECPNGHGFMPRNDSCESTTDIKCGEFGKPINVSFNTGPSLIIQDEMHLIKEGFGTIDSHFESLFESMQYEFTGEKFKNIAMSATVTGAKDQIEHLYHKKIRVFPCRLLDKNNNDFFFENILENNQPVQQRQIIGLKPNLRDNNFALLLTLNYISEFIKRVEDDLTKFADMHDFNQNELVEILKSYKNILTYHNKKSDVHQMNFFLDDYVNSKTELYQIEPLILTGDNSLDHIKESIKHINHFYDDITKKEKLLAVFATSIVSHGVDIDKWNVMMFQGMPRSTSEYIQALSRVGRKYQGIIFLWFYPNRTRDLSFYQNFNEYHNILEHKVENVPLSRWAKLGFKQTFTSVFNASILNYLSNVLERPIYSIPAAVEVFSDPKNVDILIEFIKKAYISNSKMLGSEFFDDEIEKEALERIKYLEGYGGPATSFFPNALKDNDNKYYKTQFGMRGIQDEILLSPNYYDFGFLARKRDLNE